MRSGLEGVCVSPGIGSVPSVGSVETSLGLSVVVVEVSGVIIPEAASITTLGSFVTFSALGSLGGFGSFLALGGLGAFDSFVAFFSVFFSLLATLPLPLPLPLPERRFRKPSESHSGTGKGTGKGTLELR